MDELKAGGTALRTFSQGNDQADSTGRLARLCLIGLAAVYILTLRPTIGWNDASEFVNVAYTLGIAHPPGTPTYALLSKLATFLPLGSIAVRVHLFSSFSALLAATLLYLSVRSLHRRMGGGERAGVIGGLLAASLLGVSPTLWRYAGQAEVYAAFTAVVSLLLYLAMKWEQTKDERYLLLGAFTYGLSAGIHGTSIFFAPAFAFLVATGIKKEHLGRKLACVALFGILGASVYLYLPIRAVQEPMINWGHPDTWSRFLTQISDGKDVSYHFPPAEAPWWPYIKMFAENVNSELTVAGWGLALLGISFLLRRKTRFAVFTIFLSLGNVYFFLRIWTIPDAYLPAFLLLMFWAGIALSRLLEMGSLRRRTLGFICAGALLFAVGVKAKEGAIYAAVATSDQARSAAEENLLPIKWESVVICTTSWFAMRYLQDVEGMRPDVAIIVHGDFIRPEFFDPISKARFPRLAIPNVRDRILYWDVFFQKFLSENLSRAPIYWEPLHSLKRQVSIYLRPWRYSWRFSSSGPKQPSDREVAAYLVDLQAYLTREFRTPFRISDGVPSCPARSKLGEPDSLSYHARLIAISAETFEVQGRTRDAIALFELARCFTPRDPKIANDLGQLYGGLGHSQKAEQMFRLSIYLAPQYLTPRVNLAVLQISMKRYDEARKSLMGTLAIGPRVPEAFYQLSILERKLGRNVEAERALEKAVTLAERPKDIHDWRAELAKLRDLRGNQGG